MAGQDLDSYASVEDELDLYPSIEDLPDKKEIKTGPSALGKAWDWANTSLLKGSAIDPDSKLTSPSLEEWVSNPSYSAQRELGTMLTSPLGLAGEVIGGLGLLRGLKSKPRIKPPVKTPKMLESGAWEVPPGGLPKHGKTIASLREQLGGKLPDIPMKRIGEIYNPSNVRPEELKVNLGNGPSELKPVIPVKEKIKVTASDATAYMNAVKSGEIPKNTSFADFKARISSETGALRISSNKESLPRGVTSNQLKQIQVDVIRALRSGDLIDLNQIRINSKLPKATFNKVLDDILAKGNITQNIRKAEVLNDNQAVVKLLHALDQSKPLREQQEAIYSAERSNRFSAASSVHTPGIAGHFEKLGKMSGEMPKVAPVQLEATEVDTLFNKIHSARILEGEKLHAGEGLRKLLGGTGVPQRSELALLDKVFGSGFAESVIQMHGGIGAVGLKLTKTANTMKSMNATLDASAPLRQGLGLVHRKEFWNAWKEMYGYGVSDTKFQNLNRYLEERPSYLLGRESGLYLAGEELATREEQFLTSYIGDLAEKGKVGKILTAPMRASERMYVGFLNKLRADTFDNLLRKAVEAGHNPKEIAPSIANYVNVSTGRGSLGRFAKAGEELNTVFFSPRLMSSRLTILNPKYYYDAPVFVRKEALKTLISMGVFTATVNSLGALASGKVTFDPRNSDFGKVKFGNTRLDPGGGLGQYIVAASRFVSGKSISPTSGNERELGKGYGTPSRLSLIAGVGGQEKSFMENKMSPMASLIDVLLSNKDFSGQPPDVKKEITNRFVPIITQDLTELLQNDKDLWPLLIPAAHGMGLQTFTPRRKSPPVMQAPSMSLNP